MDLGLEYSATALLLNVAYLVIGTAAGIGTIKFMFWEMNRSIGVTFTSDLKSELFNGNVAVGIYLGARMVAVFLFVGLVASSLVR